MKISRFVVGTLFGVVAAVSAGCNADDKCGANTVEVDGACVPEGGGTGECGPGTVEVAGECVPDGTMICETGTTFNPDTSRCEVDASACGEGTVLVEGECVPEGDVRQADVEEAAEPNDGLLEGDGFAMFDLPAVGEDILLHGCINPYRDSEPDGERDPDFDAFVFEATGATLIDITVDGVGGAAGGFQVIAADPQLSADGWVRFGINLVGDTTQQQVFIPAAGIYIFLAADSRSILSGFAAGSPDACYYATVANTAVPAATPITELGEGTLGTTAQFWSYQPLADGAIIQNVADYVSASAAASITEIVNGEYRGSSPFLDLGIPAAINLAGLSATDDVLLVVEPITNFSLTAVNTSLSITSIPTVELLGDGTPLTLTHDDDNPFNFVWFRANAGDVVRTQSDPGGVPFDMLLYPPSATNFDFLGFQWISDVCFQCAAIDAWVQVRETGYYYIVVGNLVAADGDTYDIAFNFTANTPTTLAPGVPNPGTLADGDRDFFEGTVADLTWLEFSVTPTNFTDARVSFYDRSSAGELDEFVPLFDQAVSSGGAPFGRIVDGVDATFLISVENDDGAVGDETFDFQVGLKDFTNAGIVDDGSPVAVPDIALAAGEPTFVFLRGGNGDAVRVTAVDDTGGTDLIVEQISRAETQLLSRNAGGAGAAESFATILNEDAFVALRVTAVGGGAGTFDLAAEVVEPLSASSSPALAIPDGDPVGVSDSVAVAEACTIAAITIDVDISHTYRGDIILDITSPNGTTVLLKEDDFFDGEDNVVGNFPATLTPVESLDALLGESGTGDWTLGVADAFDFDTGTLNTWTVNLICE